MNASALRYMNTSPEGKENECVSLQHDCTLHRDKSGGKSRRTVRARYKCQITCLPRVMSSAVVMVIRAWRSFHNRDANNTRRSKCIRTALDEDDQYNITLRETLTDKGDRPYVMAFCLNTKTMRHFRLH